MKMSTAYDREKAMNSIVSITGAFYPLIGLMQIATESGKVSALETVKDSTVLGLTTYVEAKYVEKTGGKALGRIFTGLSLAQTVHEYLTYSTPDNSNMYVNIYIANGTKTVEYDHEVIGGIGADKVIAAIETPHRMVDSSRPSPSHDHIRFPDVRITNRDNDGRSVDIKRG